MRRFTASVPGILGNTAGGGGGGDPGFNTGLRRLHVSPTSAAPLDGSTPDATFTTIQAGLDALQPGDVMTIADGRYKEVLTITNKAGTAALPIWIVAENRGQARVVNTLNLTEAGLITWTNTGSGVYSISGTRPYMGYHINNGDFLFYHKSRADLLAASLPVDTGSANKPAYGFAFEPSGGSTAPNATGTIFVKLRNSQDPNGQNIKLTDTFRRTLLTMSNADNVIIDGLSFEGSGDVSAVVVNADCANPVLRNCNFVLSRHGVNMLANNGLLFRCQYHYEGLDTWADEVIALNGTGSIAKIFDLVKDYFIGTIVGSSAGNALMEGSLEFNFSGPVSTGLIIDECLMTNCFDGSRLGEFDFSTIRNSVFLQCFDDGVSLDSPPGKDSKGNRVHDCLFKDCFRYTSHQSNDINAVGTTNGQFIYRNVFIHDKASFFHNTFFCLKTLESSLANLDAFYYHNTFILRGGASINYFLWYDFSNGTANQIERFFNNIIMAVNGLDTGSGPDPNNRENNILVRPTSSTVFQGTNGVFAGTAEADMDLDANLVPLPGSPAENAGRSLPAGLIDSNPDNTDCGAFPVGSTPGPDWPRPSTLGSFVTTLPDNWTSPGA